ncbi:MAG: nucleotidyltransferase family protein [Anaerolineales bacterium]|nr:nucleotidyltransferase family protein [Anaerolineales bacterium]MCB9128933.1 nucleotidyltransferase family protein [Ardenticatenales bacterium]
MNQDEILKRLDESREEWTNFGVASLALFGSVARGEGTRDSDVDILVDFVPPATFDRYVDLHGFLEQLLECPVDLLTTAALNDRFRPYIEGELIAVP